MNYDVNKNVTQIKARIGACTVVIWFDKLATSRKRSVSFWSF